MESTGALKISLGFDDDESNYLCRLIANLHKWHGHGLPLTHSSHRGWFWDIKPSQSEFQCPGHQARSETTLNFPWHTDCSYESSPPRFFALQVLQEDRYGGGVLSLLRVDNLLKRLSRDSKKALSKAEFCITVPPEFEKTGQGSSHIIGSLLAPQMGSRLPDLRFRDDIVTPLTSEAEQALKQFQAALHSPQTQDEVIDIRPDSLPRNSMVIVDNRRWLHSRGNVTDPARHLKRVRWDASPFG